jgi:hypothetical protein
MTIYIKYRILLLNKLMRGTIALQVIYDNMRDILDKIWDDDAWG